MAEKTWTQEIIESPVNLALLAASGYLIYKIICDLTYKEEPYVPPPKLVKDMTLKVGSQNKIQKPNKFQIKKISNFHKL